MRWLPAFLSASLFAAGSFAARKSSEERFAEFHAKQTSHAPIKLKDSSFKSLTAPPRDYSVAVVLTALDPRYGCQLCREFQPEWELLSKSWVKGDKSGESRVIFGSLDFSEGRETFMGVCVQIHTRLLTRKLTTCNSSASKLLPSSSSSLPLSVPTLLLAPSPSAMTSPMDPFPPR